MENQFVSYEQAVALKELEFNEMCFAFYDGMVLTLMKCRNSEPWMGNTVVAAPLKQQAFRWFREKYGLEGVVEKSDCGGWYKYNCYLYDEEAKLYLRDGWEIKTYEEAENACIDKLIEIAKQQDK